LLFEYFLLIKYGCFALLVTNAFVDIDRLLIEGDRYYQMVLTGYLSLRFGDLGGCQGLGAEHFRIEGIANFINPIDLSQQIRRGVAFARLLFKLITEIWIANAAPSVLLPIAYPCGLGIWAGVRGLGQSIPVLRELQIL
jgi:hypothetical protein